MCSWLSHLLCLLCSHFCSVAFSLPSPVTNVFFTLLRLIDRFAYPTTDASISSPPRHLLHSASLHHFLPAVACPPSSSLPLLLLQTLDALPVLLSFSSSISPAMFLSSSSQISKYTSRTPSSKLQHRPRRFVVTLRGRAFAQLQQRRSTPATRFENRLPQR